MAVGEPVANDTKQPDVFVAFADRIGSAHHTSQVISRMTAMAISAPQATGGRPRSESDAGEGSGRVCADAMFSTIASSGTSAGPPSPSSFTLPKKLLA